MRTAVVAAEAADEALGTAIAAHESAGDPARAVDVGSRHVVEAMTRDARAHDAEVGKTGAEASLGERIDALPEPWRTRTRREIESLKGRIETTIARRRAREGREAGS